MSDLVNPSGERIGGDDNYRCPGDVNGEPCQAGPDQRINTTGFGPPVICCNNCGYEFKGAKR